MWIIYRAKRSNVICKGCTININISSASRVSENLERRTNTVEMHNISILLVVNDIHKLCVDKWESDISICSTYLQDLFTLQNDTHFDQFLRVLRLRKATYAYHLALSSLNISCFALLPSFCLYFSKWKKVALSIYLYSFP